MPQMQIYMEVRGNPNRIDSLRIYQADTAPPAKSDAYSGLGFLAGMWLKGARNLQSFSIGGCPPEAACEKAGSDTINGRDCDKYQVTTKMARARCGSTETECSREDSESSVS